MLVVGLHPHAIARTDVLLRRRSIQRRGFRLCTLRAPFRVSLPSPSRGPRTCPTGWMPAPGGWWCSPPPLPTVPPPSLGLVVGREGRGGGRFPRLRWTHRDPPFGVGGVQSRSRNAPICPFDRDRSRRKARARSTSNERALGSVGRGEAWTWWQKIGWRT